MRDIEDAKVAEWNQSALNDFIALAIQHGLTEPRRRELLLNGLPPAVRAALPRQQRPDDQLRSDVIELAQRTGDGLTIWLENASQLCPEGAFAQRLRAMSGRPQAAPSILRQRAPAVKRRWSVLVAMVVLVFGGLAWALTHLSAREDRARAKQLVVAARKLQQAGKPRKAYVRFNEALGLAPSEPRWRAEAGWAAFKAGLLVEAESLLTQARAEVEPGELAAMIAFNLGRLREQQGKLAEAMILYRASLKDRKNATVENRLERLRKRADL